MKTKTITAVLLIPIGVLVAAYADISFETSGKPVGIASLNLQIVERHFISPVFGAIALVGGIFLLFVKPLSV